MTEQSALGWNIVGHAPADETQLLIERGLAGEQAAYVALYDQLSLIHISEPTRPY